MACLFVVAIFMASFASASRAQTLSVLPRDRPHAHPIWVQASKILSFHGLSGSQTRFGKLDWIGGLELSSDDPLFGGFSGLAFLDAEHFIAVGDKGAALSGRLVFEQGKPVDVRETAIRYLPGLGKAQRDWQRDAEGLAVRSGEAFVSFEGIVRLTRYRLKDFGFARLEGKQRLPALIEEANQANEGLEALAIAPEGSPYNGAFILLSEKVRQGRVLGWIYEPGQVRTFDLPQSDGLSVTDAAFTQQGDLIILERKVSLLGGLEIQLRRIRRSDFRPGPIEQTDVLMRGNLAYALDNMEGLDIQGLPDGDNVVSLISDDNFSALQRTLLLQFLLSRDQ
nr:esterase-like activity of phytase family protein [uncultured Cohaesibacter sp.]